MVDRDLIGRADRPARLPAEAEAAIAKARDPREVAKIRRAIGGVHVADDDRRDAVGSDPLGELGQLGEAAIAASTAHRRGWVNEPEPARFSREREGGAEVRPPLDGRPGGRLDRDRRFLEPERQATRAVGSVETVGICLCHLGKPIDPLVRDLDQADYVRVRLADQTLQRFVIVRGASSDTVGSTVERGSVYQGALQAYFRRNA